MKKVISIVIFLIMVLSFASCASNDDKVIQDGITYQKVRKTEDGVTVECYYASGCDEDIEVLNIAEKINGLSVLGISQNAFKDKTNLKEVSIPKTIKTIPLNGAPFAGCNNVEKLTLATDDVESLFKEYGCSNENNIDPLPETLKIVYLTSGCEKISMRSFRYCRYLEELHIPESVTVIEDGTAGTIIGVNGHVPSASRIRDLPFLGCENLTIYCEAKAKPTGWGYCWNYIDEAKKANVVWGTYN